MIKIVLGVGLFVVVVSAIRNRNTMRFRAWKKLMFAFFALLAIAFVVFPDISNDMAQAVGVGRGADLLLYLLVVAFLFVSVNTYLKFRDYDDVITKLARRLAIEEACRRYDIDDPVDPDGASAG